MQPWLNKIRIVIVAAAVVALVAAGARADRIRTRVGIGYDGKITGVSPDGLVIEVNGTPRSIPLADIARVEATQFPNLAKAEDAYEQGLKNNPQALAQAESLYRGLAASVGAPAWIRTLVQARMYKVYAESGRVPEALEAFLEMARNMPKLAAGLKLPEPVPDATDANKAMRDKVNAALTQGAGQPYAPELTRFKASLAITAGKPEDALKELEPLLQSPDPKVRNDAMLKQIELLLATGKKVLAAEKLDTAVQTLGPAYVAETTFLRGRVLQLQGKDKEAALEFMRVVILYPKDRNRTADALWWAGQAMEAAQAPKDEVRKVYGEAVTRYAGTAGAERAKRELTRLGS